MKPKPLIAWFEKDGTLKCWHNDFSAKGRQRVRVAFLRFAAGEIERLERLVDQLEAVNKRLTKEMGEST